MRKYLVKSPVKSAPRHLVLSWDMESSTRVSSRWNTGESEGLNIQKPARGEGLPWRFFVSCPPSLQDLAFQVQGVLLRGLDGAELALAGEIADVLPGTVQELGSLGGVDDSVGHKAAKVRRAQRHRPS